MPEKALVDLEGLTINGNSERDDSIIKTRDNDVAEIWRPRDRSLLSLTSNRRVLRRKIKGDPLHDIPFPCFVNNDLVVD